MLAGLGTLSTARKACRFCCFTRSLAALGDAQAGAPGDQRPKLCRSPPTYPPTPRPPHPAPATQRARHAEKPTRKAIPPPPPPWPEVKNPFLPRDSAPQEPSELRQPSSATARERICLQSKRPYHPQRSRGTSAGKRGGTVRRSGGGGAGTASNTACPPGHMSSPPPPGTEMAKIRTSYPAGLPWSAARLEGTGPAYLVVPEGGTPLFPPARGISGQAQSARGSAAPRLNKIKRTRFGKRSHRLSKEAGSGTGFPA